ncbi:AraC family transcriptional regulator [Mesorhizobium sp. M1A.F.Ca.IN.022.07.1.1]|uniref:helix-turn-helix transcriptional regulator n=1 Tax=Mesorhizobium sp. TaxID=1871066 RepID=UPI000FCB88B9|nr:AraC family transcriptional regulator [Mesorhizobium sp.]RUV89262.1 AraC family transcriptional regulator [Mesorhizobium sp. M1A.F.Ca.IN.022.07.1.1]RWG04714.1 MAG: AraC family transcriptional regulator [Mesorhizobium sp.]RWH01449.1 MAG: AraC family transcriptional regulator [Mesorhizobium sp.]TIN19711.1 MAG: helix-turn-helix domain-containing protein [Mesorhizobium sp.]TIN46485.1 MAG: helix-turn-helix domain-containing protein [Mesorhizobium sp.]
MRSRTIVAGKPKASSKIAATPENRDSEWQRGDDLSTWFSDILTERRPLLNAKGGLSIGHTRLVLQFLSKNFSRKLSLAEMAGACDLSPYHFARAFSTTFGASPHQYVLKLRLDYAEKLLADGGLSITDIADLSGFSSQSHFTTTMKKYRNVTPLQVRARQLDRGRVSKIGRG